MPAPSFLALVDRLQSGTESATAEVYQRYATRLLDLIRRRLDARFRGVLSASDVVQEALLSFFRREREQPFDLENEAALWGLLVSIALHKHGNLRAKLKRQKRYPGQVLSLDWASAAGTGAVSGREPIAADDLVFNEIKEELLADLDSVSQRICLLRLEGHKVRQIAREVDLTEETVSRKLAKVKTRLLEILERSRPLE